MVTQRTPVILGVRQRPVDRYREVIERYSALDERPTDRLPNRGRLVDSLVEQVRPLLDAIVDAETSGADVLRVERRQAEHEATTSLAVVTRFELVRARDRRRLALARLRELLRDEEMVLRYLLLRQLVCSDRPSPRRRR